NLVKDLSFPDHSSFGKEDFLKHALGTRAHLNSLAGRSLANKLAEDGHGFLCDFGHDYRWRQGLGIGGLGRFLLTTARDAQKRSGAQYRCNERKIAHVATIHGVTPSAVARDPSACLDPFLERRNPP